MSNTDADPVFIGIIGTLTLMMGVLFVGMGAETAGFVTEAELEHAFGVGALIIGVGVTGVAVLILASAVREVVSA